MPALPDADEPVADLIERRRRQSRRKLDRVAAERWMPIAIADPGPFAIAWVGDPHLDDDACDWDLLLSHVELIKRTPGMYAFGIGDVTNNWVGRLIRLYADQKTTLSDARRLARWFLRDAGIPWIGSLLGNHDEWEHGEAILGLISDGAVYLPYWETRLEFRAGGAKFRVHAAHDFAGSSIYNKTHGPARAAMFSGGAAELLVCGHRHHVGSQGFEIEENGTYVRAVRARGYKAHDRHAIRCGFPQGRAGATVVTVFDPHAATPAGRVTVFEDPEAGALFLAALRARDGLPIMASKPKTKPKRKPTKSKS